MISERLNQLKPSPTLALAAKAKSLKAEGKDVISLSVGEPDWDTFEKIKRAGIRAIQDGQTKYTPSSGLPALRKTIAEQTSKETGVPFSFENVTVSAGGKFVIYSALQSLVNPGDEVVISAPYWVSYPSIVELCGGVPVIAVCEEDSGFRLSAETLENALTEKTKVLILNSPSNPTGCMYSEDELAVLGEVLLKYPNVVIMSDDIYNRLVFSQRDYAPHILKVNPALSERTVVINGLAKSYSMTGWRVGWAVGPKNLVGAMSRIQSQSVSCASPFSQIAAIEAITNCDEEVSNSVKTLIERRDFAVRELSKVNGVEVGVPDGAFYLWPNIKQCLGKTYQGKKIETSREFAAHLLDSQMVACVPGIEFGLEGYLRLSYALSKEKMSEAIARIATFISELS